MILTRKTHCLQDWRNDKMNKKIFLFSLGILLVLLIAGCSKFGTQPTDRPTQPVAGDEEKTLDDDLQSLDSSLESVDKLSQDLSTNELEDVDSELSEAETADI